MKGLAKSVITLLLLMLLLVHEQRAQQTNYLRFDLFTIDQKISQNDIFCIMQDSKGFLWFGTQDGLNKYDGYEFTIYRYEPSDPNSLSDGFITALCEDRSGNIWIGTKTGGVNLFHRPQEDFIAYQHIPGNPASLSHNHITSILEDSRGNLWFGTEGGGLSKATIRNGKVTFKSYKHDPAVEGSISDNMVTAVFEDSRNNLWIGTKNGLNLMNRDKETFKVYKNVPLDAKSLGGNQVSAIFEDRRRMLWVGVRNGGLNKFSYATQTFKVYRNNPGNPNSLSDNDVSAIHEEHTGLLWVGTHTGGLNEFDPKNETFVQYKANPQISHSLSHNEVISLLEDRSGTLWIGTLNGGLNKLNRRTKQFVHYETNPGHSNDLGHSYARSIYEDDEHALWVATSSGGALGGGLKKFDRTTGKITTYEYNPDDPSSISHNGVWAIYPNAKGGGVDRAVAENVRRNDYFWIGTTEGLNKFNKKTGRFIRYKNEPGNPNSLSSNYIYDIYEDRNGVVWLGTFGGGLNRVVFEGEKIKQVMVYKHDPNDPSSISDDEITDIHEDSEHIFWIGTRNGGLNRLDPATGKFTAYKSQHNKLHTISHNNVNSIYEDASGKLWIATYGGGFNIFDKRTGVFTRVSEKDGLPNNVVYGILPDSQGNFWLSSNKGISRYNPKDKVFKNYFVNDGLQSNEFNRKSYYKSPRGEMFFGGVNGFNAFYPDSIRMNDYRPNVVITEFKVFNKTIPIRDSLNPESPLTEHINITDEIVLPYEYNVFEFGFAALHFDFPEKNMYAYMMENFDDGWITTDASKRFATYTNLPPGTYTFRVKASNSDGIWNETGAAVRIIITPPFWRTDLFYFLCAAAFIGSVSGFMIRREQRLKNSKRKLEEMVAQRTAEVLKQKDEIEIQRNEIELQKNKTESAFKEIQQKNKNITSSINYAKRIQEAMLPLPEQVSVALPESFVIFKPRDIVSGDFYWFSQVDSKIIIAAIDCTGHGVPGAFMSLIGESMLNEIVKSQCITDPADILNKLHLSIRKALKQEEKDNRDGMDMAICVIDKVYEDYYIVEFAGAKNPMVMISGCELKLIAGDKYPIGGLQREDERLFTKHTFHINTPTTFYIFSDGYQDQFGGPKDTKFSLRRFRELLLQVHSEPMEKQKEVLLENFEDWKGNSHQIDDILVIGFRLGASGEDNN